MLADYGRLRFFRYSPAATTPVMTPFQRFIPSVGTTAPRTAVATTAFTPSIFSRGRVFTRRYGGYGDLGGLTQDFEAAKSRFETASIKVAQFTKSPITTKKYAALNDQKKAIMLGGGPEGGQVDDAVVKRWISEADSVVNDINSLYQTYIANKPVLTTTGGILSSPPTVGAPGQDQIFGMNKWLVYGVGGLVVAGLLTYIMPKKPAPLKMSEV